MTIHRDPNNPMIVFTLNELSLEAKAIYGILSFVDTHENETPRDKINRCCGEENYIIENAIRELIAEGYIDEDF